MTVMAIGIGSHVDSAELAVIATDSNHTFHVSTFDALQTINNDLTQTTCSSEYHKDRNRLLLYCCFTSTVNI